jgi:hypothetical protein
MTVNNIGCEHVEDRIRSDFIENRPCRPDGKGLPFPQGKKPGDLVDLGACQHDAADRRVAGRTARMQRWRGDDLCPQVGGSIDKQPMLAIGRNGDTRLRAKGNPGIALPCEAAHRAKIIPLRKAAAGGRTEHNGGQPPHMRARRKRDGLEFSGEIAVDFQSDADFDKCRCGPDHDGGSHSGCTG